MGQPSRAEPSAASGARDVALRAHEASLLVDRAKAGDTAAFTELVRRYRPRIYALALHLTGSRSDADDITQDAFLRAYRKLAEFEGRSEFFTWLYRIALHRALNVRRDRRRRPTVDLEDARVEIAVKLDAAGDPRRAMELRETYAHLVAALDKLSPVLRTTVVLTTLQGLSYREAAVVLGTTEGTIAWRVHEAREQIRRTLEAYAAGERTADVRPRKTVPEGAAREAEQGLALELALALLRPA
jgi:RNA polymerase sigma-70 factor (ECF subfamily)